MNHSPLHPVLGPLQAAVSNILDLTELSFLVIADHQWDKYNPLFSLVYLVIGKVLHSNY